MILFIKVNFLKSDWSWFHFEKTIVQVKTYWLFKKTEIDSRCRWFGKRKYIVEKINGIIKRTWKIAIN